MSQSSSDNPTFLLSDCGLRFELEPGRQPLSPISTRFILLRWTAQLEGKAQLGFNGLNTAFDRQTV